MFIIGYALGKRMKNDNVHIDDITEMVDNGNKLVLKTQKRNSNGKEFYQRNKNERLDICSYC